MSTPDLDRRLAEANPVPQPPAVEASGLFAQITSLPPDPRVRPRRAGRRRLVVILVAAIVAVAVLSSTALAVTRLVDQWVKPPVTKKEYVKAQTELTLPPGYTWPKLHIQANTVTSPGAGGGDAVMAAMWAWEDYWVTAIHGDDSAAQQQAHDELLALLDHHVVIAPSGASENWSPPDPPDGPYAVFADDGGAEAMRKWWAAAAAGPPGMLEQIVRANAPE
jgi:hypothetical protein